MHDAPYTSIGTVCGLNQDYGWGSCGPLQTPSDHVRRLLELAARWPDSTPDVLPALAGCKTTHQLRPAEVDKLVEEYQAGATTYELGARFGVWRGTVGRHLNARGIDTRAPNLRQDDLHESS
jgi:hypothetical protein